MCDAHNNDKKYHRNFTIVIGLGISWNKWKQSTTSIKLPMFIIEKNVSNRKDNNTYYCNQKNGMCTKDIMAKQILPVYKAFLKEKKFMLCRTLILLD